MTQKQYSKALSKLESIIKKTQNPEYFVRLWIALRDEMNAKTSQPC